MKVYLFAIVAVCLFAACSEAAVSRSSPKKVAGHEGKCWYADAGWDLIPGESRTVRSKCLQVNCHDDFSMSYYTCGVIGSDCDSTISDLNRDYPDCCPIPNC